VASNVTPIRKAVARPAADAELGIQWWNRLSERGRLQALRAADTAVPAEAWEWWKRTPTGCDEQAHG
jgi:hypothetical protein